MAKRSERTEIGRCPWAKTDLYVQYHDTNGACRSTTTGSCSSS